MASGPYKYLPENPGVSLVSKAGGVGTLTWAFASGECGDESWGKVPGAQVASENVAAFQRAGIRYIISTGGQAGVFTCATTEGMDRFMRRYDSPQLAGIDFDIEGSQTPEQIEALVRQAAYAQRKYPRLRYSFTVGTLAASDGSRQSLNPTGETILKALRASGMRDYVINLMVMDYGPPSAKVCVVKAGACDMGRSAIQAVRNVHGKYGVPLAQIAITAMIGVNDVANNDTTLDDARFMAQAAKKMKLAGVHYWSLDRDTPCTTSVTGASPVCSGMEAKAGAFAKAFGLR
jgi:hypothetical protein